ncbi:hypothetical protein BKA62DRAFT_672763 [Auriculariales sp. MPI-PUGE-AT-0066]|nr:hypothetical protein BKA62DRAFT_672763 [Auriculariales sp. MPI-PUGE-AT-0066]
MPASRPSRLSSSTPSDQDSLATNHSSPVASVDGEGPLFLPAHDTPPPASPPLPGASAVLPGPNPEWPTSKVDPRFFVTSDPRDVTYAMECTAEAYRTVHSEHGKCAATLKESQDLVEILKKENSLLRSEVYQTRTHHTEAIVWLTQMRNGIHLLRDSIHCRGCKQICEHMMWVTCGHSYCNDCISWALNKEGYCRIFQCYKYHYEQDGHRFNLAFDPVIHTFWMVERTLKVFDEYQQDQDRRLHFGDTQSQRHFDLPPSEGVPQAIAEYSFLWHMDVDDELTIHWSGSSSAEDAIQSLQAAGKTEGSGGEDFSQLAHQNAHTRIADAVVRREVYLTVTAITKDAKRFDDK